MRKIKSENLIIKANQLVEAKYRLTVNEQKVIYKLISLIKKDDDCFKTYSIKIKDLSTMIDTKSKNMYSQIKLITRSLQKKIFTIYDSKRNEELHVSWLASSLYKYGEGIVELEFSYKLKPYLLQLKEAFTKFDLNNVLKLKSVYSCRIYEFLKQYERIGQRVMCIDDIKSKLDIIDEYKLYTNFKQKVITQAQKEINEKTDIYFEYEELKEGRKVVAIKFLIKDNLAITLKDNIIKDSFDTKTSKSLEEKNIAEYNEINELISDFNYKYKGNLDYNLIKNLVKLKGIDCVKTCVIEFADFVDNANKVESAFYDFAKKYGTSSAYTKGNVYRNMIGNKPIQATNYEQREYDDEFFDKLYVNYEFVKDELNNKKKM